jgi:hypothetical protein
MHTREYSAVYISGIGTSERGTSKLVERSGVYGKRQFCMLQVAITEIAHSCRLLLSASVTKKMSQVQMSDATFIVALSGVNDKILYFFMINPCYNLLVDKFE